MPVSKNQRRDFDTPFIPDYTIYQKVWCKTCEASGEYESNYSDDKTTCTMCKGAKCHDAPLGPIEELRRETDRKIARIIFHANREELRLEKKCSCTHVPLECDFHTREQWAEDLRCVVHGNSYEFF